MTEVGQWAEYLLEKLSHGIEIPLEWTRQNAAMDFE